MGTINKTVQYTGVMADPIRAIMLKALSGDWDDETKRILTEGDEAMALRYKVVLENTLKSVRDRINYFDSMVDKVHDGTLGADYMPKLTRIYEPRGRKVGEKVELSVEDKLSALGL